jgi:hypothetical protein
MTTCTEPDLHISYKVSIADTMHYKLNSYKKGSNFTELISTETGIAYLDTTTGPHVTMAYHYSAKAGNDYIIEVLSTGKSYRITDIHYDGDKRKPDDIKSESRIRCTRTTYFTVNGEVKKQEGSTYDKGSGGPIYPTVHISE